MEKKKRIIIAAFSILISLALLSHFNLLEIIGESLIDTRAVLSETAINITITDDFPSVNIFFPVNQTYNHLDNIVLNFTINDSNLDSKWYSLNGGSNTTLSSNITLTPQANSNTLIVYANDSFNQIRSVTRIFFVNESLGEDVVLPSTYQDSVSDTTNFSSLNKSQQQNLINMTLHAPNFGKVRWSETINLSENSDGYGSSPRLLINLSAYTAISNNRVYISSEDLTQLNNSATVEIYNLTFSNPRILRDDAECPAAICTLVSYVSGTLIFNVDHFSEYSAEEGAETSQTQQTGKNNWPTATIIKTNPDATIQKPGVVGEAISQNKPRATLPANINQDKILQAGGLRNTLGLFGAELMIIPFILLIVVFLILLRRKHGKK